MPTPNKSPGDRSSSALPLAAARSDTGWSTWMYKEKVWRLNAVLRRRMCEMAASHVRYGYQRLTVLLRRWVGKRVPWMHEAFSDLAVSE